MAWQAPCLTWPSTHQCEGWQGLWRACIWVCLPPAGDESPALCSSATGWAGGHFLFLLSAWQFFLSCTIDQRKDTVSVENNAKSTLNTAGWRSLPTSGVTQTCYLFISKKSFLFGSKIFLNSATTTEQKRTRSGWCLMALCLLHSFTPEETRGSVLSSHITMPTSCSLGLCFQVRRETLNR